MSRPIRHGPAGGGGGPGTVDGFQLQQMALPPLTPVVKRLLIANGVCFLLFFLAEWAGVKGPLQRALAVSPATWREWFPFLPLWQPFTYGFLHATEDLGHLAFNMLGLYFFGTMLEEALGSRRFTVTYFAAMLAGALLHLLIELLRGSVIPTIGASGAVVGTVVAMAVLRPNQRVFLLFIPITLKWLAILWVAFDLYPALRDLATGSRGGGTAHWVHLGGALYGFLAVRLGLVWRDPIRQIEIRRAIAREERRQSDEQRMDALLRKIHEQGMGSLSRREREFLKRVSSKR